MKRELPDLKVTPPVVGEKVTLVIGPDGKQYDLPVLGGTHGPKVIDVRRLYADTGYLTYDPGFMSTANCDSAITYIGRSPTSTASAAFSCIAATPSKTLPHRRTSSKSAISCSTESCQRRRNSAPSAT